MLGHGVKVAASTVWEILREAGIDPAPRAGFLGRGPQSYSSSPAHFPAASVASSLARKRLIQAATTAGCSMCGQDQHRVGEPAGPFGGVAVVPQVRRRPDDLGARLRGYRGDSRQLGFGSRRPCLLAHGLNRRCLRSGQRPEVLDDLVGQPGSGHRNRGQEHQAHHQDAVEDIAAFRAGAPVRLMG